ncbi:type I polyketide synthase [Streptomyces fuscichromogenes]|uniref:type I polyketide synthase n=1 Tax=Streptomyces fuscichromogenes TaxID=1324013 RepID=UPI0038136DAF
MSVLPRELSSPAFPSADEPVAIVGMACRYPGGTASPEELWEFVAAGRSSVQQMPRDRGWDLELLLKPDRREPGSSATSFGHFIEDGAGFDPEFFGISAREAQVMHPAQRLVLMTAWEAIERAGIVPSTLRGDDVGVFTGVACPDYGPQWHEAPRGIKGRIMMGTTPSAVAGRVSYILGFHGPAMTLDTACSSSSAAIHLACQSLRAGESSLALAGGVTFHSSPGGFTEFSPSRALAPDGRCKPFSDSADGAAWADGVGMLLLARLPEAQRLGLPVLALIRGSAVNQDGASSRFSAPSGDAQEMLIRKALGNAGLSARDIDAVEAHGTGTKLGDPIEARALIATYGQDRPYDRPLYLGSLKSNIGHAMAAAGVGGIIKMVMAMHHGELPRTLHVEGLNSRVDWAAGAVQVLTERVPWPPGDRLRRAGVSSFGVSGTNAHTILEEAPPVPALPPTRPGPSSPAATVPWILSARSGQALRAQAERLHRLVTGRPEHRTMDIGHALAVHREHFEHRAAVTARRPDEFIAGLRAIVEGRPAATVSTAVTRSAGRAVFVFPGQGAQWRGMAAELLDTSEVFAAHIQECAEALAPYCDWSLVDVLVQSQQAPPLERVDVVQPALFAVMVSLAGLWASHGIRPAAVVGHSQGEIAAACVSGALSLADAAKVVALRSRALRKITGDYGMASVAASPAELRRYLPDRSALSVAVVNGPRATVLAGTSTELTTFIGKMNSEGVRARMLPVDYASHSVQVESVRDDIIGPLSDIIPRRSDVPFYSTVTGGRLRTTAVDAAYWYANLRQTVRFSDTVRIILEDGLHHFLEISPHPVLIGPLEDTVEEAGADQAVVLATLRRDDGGADRFTRSLAEAHVHGLAPDWETVFAAEDATPVDLPTYPFQNRRFWLDDTPATTRRAAVPGVDTVEHPFLQAVTAQAENDGLLFVGSVSLGDHPWLADHAVQDQVLLPGAAVVELLSRAGEHVGCASVAELTIRHPLALSDDAPLRLQVALGAVQPDGRRTARVYSRPESADGDVPWTRHADGLLVASPADRADQALAEWPPAADAVDTDALYDRFDAAGIQYGPLFRAVTSCWQRGSEYFAEVVLPAAAESAVTGFGLHPALFDSALHVLGLSVSDTGAAARLPFEWSGVSLHTRGATRLRVWAALQADGSFRLRAADTTGRTVLTVDCLTVLPVPAGWAQVHSRYRSALFHQEWRPTKPPNTPPPAGTWAAVGTAPTTFTVSAPPSQTYSDLDSLRKALAAGAATPDVAVLPVEAMTPVGPEDLATTTQRLVCGVLDSLQEWLADEQAADTRLVLLTRGAVSASPGEAADPALAAVWGLVRSAQSENPGRLVLADLDADAASLAALPAALACPEPQVAIRSGTVKVPRLTRPAPDRTTAPAMRDGFPPRALDPEGTVLITGGTGTVGSVLARHLVVRHGVRRLLLAGRQGVAAPGSEELTTELTALGAEVTVAGCDVSDRTAVAGLLASIPARHPLTAVIHAAAVLSDGVIASMTADRVARVMAPKVHAACHLDELTEGQDLAAFVLFSSCAGVFGTAGQGNYAAANVFLEALAQRRRARGQAATALAWGLWEERSELTARIDDRSLDRMASGTFIAPLSTQDALALFDDTWMAREPVAVPVRFAPSLRNASYDAVAPVLRDLVPARHRPEAEPRRSMVAELAGLPDGARRRALTDLVRTQAAAVLGLESADSIGHEDPFRNHGMESLNAVELRNRLSSAIGRRLTAAVVFDHPTPSKLAAHIQRLLDPDSGPEHRSEPGPGSEQQTAVTAATVPSSDIDVMDVDALVALAAGRTNGSEPDLRPSEEVAK